MDLDRLWEDWNTNKTPKRLATLVDATKPEIDKAIQSSGGTPNPVTRGMAKRIVVHAAKTFKPGTTKFSSWTHTQLRRLTRQVRDQRFGVRIPERRARMAFKLKSFEDEFQATNNRIPSDDEAADMLGISKKRIARLRKSGNTPELITESDDPGEPVKADRSDLIMDMLYVGADPIDKVILERMFGYNDNDLLSGKELAKKLGITESAVSQRVSRIRSRMADAESAV